MLAICCSNEALFRKREIILAAAVAAGRLLAFVGTREHNGDFTGELEGSG